MTREEAIRQRQSLRDHCQSMVRDEHEDGIWVLDIAALDFALTALRPVSREQVERVWKGCKHCTEEWGTCNPITNRFTMPPRGGIRFCPMCGKPLTDEAVEMVMERLEELKDGETD